MSCYAKYFSLERVKLKLIILLICSLCKKIFSKNKIKKITGIFLDTKNIFEP